MMIFPTTRAAGLRRMEAFLPKAREYGRERNFVRPGHGAVSRLSPLLRHRLLLESEVAQAAIDAHGFRKVEKFVQEVYWRRYWKAWLSHRPQVWREACDFPGPSMETGQGKHAHEVMAGASGNAVIDHFVHELRESGYLHNHARMWVAAWWIHQAGLPWQWGAAFFMSHLLDGDPASNTLSWRWVAGLQTPGKTYLARRANLEKYLDPEILAQASDSLAEFERASPQLPESMERPEITVPVLQEEIPEPGLATGLWVHEENLAPERSALAELKPGAITVAGHAAGWARLRYSDLRRRWIEEAMADAACRAATHWRVPARYDVPADLADALVSWAVGEKLEQMVVMRPEPGPLDDDLPMIRQKLADTGVRLVVMDREEDLALRPLARRGFFQFWKKLSPRFADSRQAEFDFS